MTVYLSNLIGTSDCGLRNLRKKGSQCRTAHRVYPIVAFGGKFRQTSLGENTGSVWVWCLRKNIRRGREVYKIVAYHTES